MKLSRTYNREILTNFKRKGKDIERKLRTLRRKIKIIYYLHWSKPKPGSNFWLIGTELKYGGKTRVNRNKIAPFHSSMKEDLVQTHIGGDRMLLHGYADLYSSYLHTYVEQGDKRLTVCEFGILQGTGLAMWCDLFPNSRCIGFDIDLSYLEKNMDNLLNIGAFSVNQPELHYYDQFVHNAEYLGEILNGDKIDICMDDGDHSEEAIATTFRSVLPHLNHRFVYFIEDNEHVHKISSLFEGFTIHVDGELTIITPSQNTPTYNERTQ